MTSETYKWDVCDSRKALSRSENSIIPYGVYDDVNWERIRSKINQILCYRILSSIIQLLDRLWCDEYFDDMLKIDELCNQQDLQFDGRFFRKLHSFCRALLLFACIELHVQVTANSVVCTVGN